MWIISLKPNKEQSLCYVLHSHYYTQSHFLWYLRFNSNKVFQLKLQLIFPVLFPSVVCKSHVYYGRGSFVSVSFSVASVFMWAGLLYVRIVFTFIIVIHSIAYITTPWLAHNTYQGGARKGCCWVKLGKYVLMPITNHEKTFPCNVHLCMTSYLPRFKPTISKVKTGKTVSLCSVWMKMCEEMIPDKYFPASSSHLCSMITVVLIPAFLLPSI